MMHGWHEIHLQRHVYMERFQLSHRDYEEGAAAAAAAAAAVGAAGCDAGPFLPFLSPFLSAFFGSAAAGACVPA